MLTMKDWLKKNNLKIGAFADLMNCHRETIRRIDKDLAIEQELALKIELATGGEVIPRTKRRGKPACEQNPQLSTN